MKPPIIGSLLTFIFLVTSCNTSQKIASNTHKKIELAARGPLEITNNQAIDYTQEQPAVSNTLEEIEPVLAANKETIALDKKATLQSKLIRIEKMLNQHKQVQRLTFVERLVLKKVLKKVDKQQKLSTTTTEVWYDWDGKLKIGVILIGIAILLSILRVSGAVTGLAALVGLVFVVWGLLNTY